MNISTCIYILSQKFYGYDAYRHYQQYFSYIRDIESENIHSSIHRISMPVSEYQIYLYERKKQVENGAFL